MSSDLRKKYIKCLTGFWLEDYIAKILLELRDENVIESVFSSVIRIKDDKFKKEIFEVDFVIYNNFSLKYISVTTIGNDDIAKFKLYEVKTRASQLAGDEKDTEVLWKLQLI